MRSEDERRVLVVDDDEDHAWLLELSLKSHGYAVLTAHSCAGARDLLRDNRVDALITDFSLGDGDGADLVQSLGADRPPIAILLSGYDLPARDPSRAPFDAVFVKPLQFDRLVATLAGTRHHESGFHSRITPTDDSWTSPKGEKQSGSF